MVAPICLSNSGDLRIAITSATGIGWAHDTYKEYFIGSR